MLGWWITVSKGSIAEDLPQDATLASWEVGLGGVVSEFGQQSTLRAGVSG